MCSEQITAFLQEHWNLVTLIFGAVLLIGAIMNWNWLCDPTGKPDSHRYGRGSRRGIFFLLGIVLIVTSIMSWVLYGHCQGNHYCGIGGMRHEGAERGGRYARLDLYQ